MGLLEEFRELKNFLQGKTVEDAVAQIQQELDLLDNASVNIAITGISGAGKSSLVNALRGVDDRDEQNAAPVGFTETTMYPAKYPHPTFSNVVFWDLPGTGTPDFKPDEYLKRVNFSVYDFFIIVARDRFTVHDVTLAHEIRKMEKKFYFVRTQIDVSLNAGSREQGFSEEAALKKIRNYCYENLKKAGEPSAKVFLVSSWYPERYDFFLLQEALKNNLDRIKEQALIRAMPAYSPAALEKKKDAMQALIWKLALVSCVVGAVPVPGVSFAFDMTILMRGMKLFCVVFGVDGRSLERLAKRIDQPVAELKSAVKICTFDREIRITEKFVIQRIVRSSLCLSATVLETLLNFIPVIGSLAGAGLSFLSTYYMLIYFLRDVVEDAESICKKATELNNRSRRFPCAAPNSASHFASTEHKQDEGERNKMGIPLHSEATRAVASLTAGQDPLGGSRTKFRSIKGSQTIVDDAIMKPFVREDFEAMNTALAEADPQEAISRARQNLDLYEKTTLDIGITGQSGAGKSSLVNALRGLDDDDDNNENVAKTDVVQGTLEPKGYLHPLLPNVTVWDLPGIGTEDFQAAKYLKQVPFDKYDFFIIVSATRFTENDAKLAQEIQKKNKKFYFVRSKIDIDLYTLGRKKNFREEKTLEKIRNDCEQHLKQRGQPTPRVFLISRWDLDKYDFPRLQMTLAEELDDHKSKVLILAMPAFSKEVLEKKKKAMEKLIWIPSLVSCGVGATPVPGLSFPCNVAFLVGTLKLFCKVFGLDNAAIGRLAKQVGKNEAVLMSEFKKSPMASEITPQFVVKHLQKSYAEVCATPMELEFLLDFVPILGSITGGVLSFGTTFYMLKRFLNDAMEDVNKIAVVTGKS